MSACDQTKTCRRTHALQALFRRLPRSFAAIKFSVVWIEDLATGIFVSLLADAGDYGHVERLLTMSATFAFLADRIFILPRTARC